MARVRRRRLLDRVTVVVATLTLVAAGLSVPEVANADPGKGPGPGSGSKVQPRGDGGWQRATPPKPTTVPYQPRTGNGGPAVLRPDPHAKRVRELTNQRTADSSTFQMSDGSLQREVSALPVHYRDAKGVWQSIDPTVKPVTRNSTDNTGFTAGAQANSFQTFFSPNASALVRIQQGTRSIQVGADSASTAALATSGPNVSYRHAYPGADLDYQVGPESLKQSIVLSQAPAVGQTFSFTVRVGGGLTPQQLPDGAIEFRGSESSAPVFTIPAPYMSDAKADPNSPYSKVYSTNVSQVMTFDAATGTVHLTIRPDSTWLADAKRVYPVTIDPTILVSPTPSTAANTMILADGPTDNYSTSWRLSVGTTPTGAARTLIKFPLAAIPAGTTVSAAHLRLYYDQTFTTGSNTVPMQALQANASWSATTATWNSAKSIGGPVAGTSSMAANTSATWVDFPVTSAVQSWVNGSANNGFVIKATNETPLGQGGPRFEGSIYAYGGEVVNYPKLVIDYGVPGVAVNPPTVIHATGAELSWPAYTNNTGDPANDLAEYQVHRSVFQAFTPGQNTLVSPAAGARSFVDSTAVPTAAASADPYGNAYYYMVVVKTKGGRLIAGPTQLVRLPKAGRTTILVPAAAATTLSSSQPSTVLNTLTDAGVKQPWLEVGDNSATYGVARSIFDFGQLSQVPAGSRILDAHLKVWQEITTTTTSGAVYELHGLTRSFTATQATWNSAATGTAWSTAGGDFSATVAGTVSGLTNDPNRQNLDATSIVQGWVNTTGSNHGLLVKLKSEATTGPQERTIFAGPKTAEPQLAPQLVVTYLDSSTQATYYAPATPSDMVLGRNYTVPVTINNTTSATWPAASEVLTYHWTLPDGTDVTTPANQLKTALPSDLAPGATVTLNAQVTPPAPIGGNESEGYALAWDMYNAVTGTYLSGAGGSAAQPNAGTSGPGSLKQQVSVDPSGNNQLGLEEFYQYTTTPTGAGSALYTNVSSGNTVWNHDLFSNPSVGFDTTLRLSYNSLSTFDTNTGFGWSVQASTPTRLGQALQFNPPPDPTEVVMVDGTGNAHKWTWNATTNTWISPPGVHLYLQRLVSCTPQTESARAWLMTRPNRTKFYFDCAGYPTAEVDPNGNEADFTYIHQQSQNEPKEFLSYVTDPFLSRSLTLTYYAKGETYPYIDSTGNLVTGTNLTDPQIIDHVKSISDVSGRTINFYYTLQGLLGRVVDGAGDPQAKTFNFTYDMTQGMKNVKLIGVQDPRGHTTAIAYYPPLSPWKWMTQSVTDRLNHGTSFAYLEPGVVPGAAQQTTVTDANGHSVVYQVDSAGRMIQVVNPLNQKTTLEYDSDNNVSRLTEPNGAQTNFTSDGNTGYPLTRSDSVTGTATYTYQFGLGGHVADLTDMVSGAGRHWRFSYDLVGNMLSAQEPNGTATGSGFTTRYTYDSFGSLTSVTDANNNTTSYSYFLPIPVTVYEPTGLPRSITDPLGNITRKSYGPRGELTSITDQLGSTSTQNYDLFLRPLDARVPKDQAAGIFTNYPAPVYDGNDNVTRSTQPNGAVSTAGYDADDQVTSITLPPDTATSPTRTATFTYDAVGNQRTTTEPNGNLPGAVPGSYTTTVDYDEANQATRVTDALGGTSTTTYDNVGNKIQFTDPLNNVTKVSYDLAHRPTGATDPQQHTASVQYDADGFVTSNTDQNNATTFYSLDPNGQVTQVQVPHIIDVDTVIFDTTQYTYDQVGNNISVISPKGVEAKDQGIQDAFTTSARYDADNRRTNVFGAYDPTAAHDADYGVDNRPQTDYVYDAASRPTQVTQHIRARGRAESSATSTVSYFDNGWIKHSVDPFGITTDYNYNELGEQTLRILTSSDATASRVMTWGYYPDGKQQSSGDSGIPNGWQDQIVTASSFNTEFPPGAWDAGPRGAGFDGSTYFTNAAGQFTFKWNLTVPQDGDYTIYVWYPHLDDAGLASYSVNGSQPIDVNQQQNTGSWVPLVNPDNNGEWHLKAGTGSNVVLRPNGVTVAADAVRIVRDNSHDPQPLPNSITYTYDANGNHIDVADDSPNAQFDHYPAVFDELNRLTRLQEKSGDEVKHTLAYTYDADSNPLTQANDDATDTYTYDSRNMLSTVVNKQNSADPGITTTYKYTPTGQRESQTKGNKNKVGYTYNADGTLSSIVELTAGGTRVNSHLLTYDPNNNITQDISTLQNADDHGAFFDRTVTREYSPNNQVTKVTNSDGKNNQEYTYDSAGNITDQTVHTIVDGNDVPVQIDFGYDRGRVAFSTVLAGDLPTGTYQYDTFGRLHAVANGFLFGQTTGVAQSYNYDGFDNVTSQSSQSAATGSLVNTTSYTYDSLNRPITAAITSGGTALEHETIDYLGTTRSVDEEQITFDAGGQATKTYDYDPSGERLAMLDTFIGPPPPVSQTSYYTYNPHQDVEALTTDDGQTQATYGYTAYGADDTTQDSGVDKDSANFPIFPYNSYRYNTARIASTTGNLDMGFRTYNPNINQFISRDQYNSAGADAALGFDRYGFAGGNPITNVELDGHDWWATVGSIAAGIGVIAGCALLGVATEGVGLILCGIAAGAAAGAVGQTINCAQGQAGACSAGAFTQSILVGGFIGGITAGLGAELAGALPVTMSGWASGAIVGVATGAIGGAAGYVLTCADQCSWGGLAEATLLSAVLGGAIGAGWGAIARSGVQSRAATAVRAKVAQMRAAMTPGEVGRTTYAAAHVTTAEGNEEMWVAGAGQEGYARPGIRGTARNMKFPAPPRQAGLPHINDAEMHLYRSAVAAGARINAIGATRPVCNWCQLRLPRNIPIVTERK